MLPRLAWLPKGLVLLVSLGGCRALLDGDEVTFESTGSGAGTGTGAGTGGTTASTTVSATSDSATSSSQASTTGTGGEGGNADGPPCVTTDEVECTFPEDSERLHLFRELCPSEPWCMFEPDPSDAISDLYQTGGQLLLRSTPQMIGTGWWSDASRAFGPYLFKRLTGNFVVVVQHTVSGGTYDPATSNSIWKLSGLLFRGTAGPPMVHANEHWITFSYGYLDALPTPIDTPASHGFLVAQDTPTQPFAAHVDVELTASAVGPVKLGACRIGPDMFFYANAGGPWIPLDQRAIELTSLNDSLAVGLFSVGWMTSGGHTTGLYDYFGIRTGTAATGANCLERIQNLDMELIAGRSN